MDKTPHQVLAPKEQEHLDKEKLQKLLIEHNLGENVDLIYKIITECAITHKHIDDCIEKVLAEFNENGLEDKDEKDVLKHYRKLFNIE